ncbi:MAG TPA: GIY-YIG nuclease family protein [Hyphomicrobiaceae bacterium]|jgi:putative endonuclease
MRAILSACIPGRSAADEVRGAQSRGLAGSFQRERAMRDRPPKVFHVYIMASKPRGVLYVGMTSDLAGRAWKHREHVLEVFSKRYWVDRLVYFEGHDDASVAARRERAMKRWRRDWKIELVEKSNPIPDLIRDAISSATCCGTTASSGEEVCFVIDGEDPG